MGEGSKGGPGTWDSAWRLTKVFIFDAGKGFPRISRLTEISALKSQIRHSGSGLKVTGEIFQFFYRQISQ